MPGNAIPEDLSILVNQINKCGTMLRSGLISTFTSAVEVLCPASMEGLIRDTTERGGFIRRLLILKACY
jgi:hypothetical protein